MRSEELRTTRSRLEDVPSMRQFAMTHAKAASGGSAFLESVAAAGPLPTNSTVYIGVISAPMNVQKRREVRERWLTAVRQRFAVEDGERPRVQAEFIIGRQPINNGQTGREQGAKATDGETSREELLVSEAEEHGDIYRIPAAESYAELPDKVLLMLGHALDGGYSFIVKIDDDQHLDIDTLISTVESADLHDPLYAGPFHRQAGADDEFVPYFGCPCYMLSSVLANGIAREHLEHSVAYNTYGSTSEDVDMGRWVAYEDQFFSKAGTRAVEFRTVELSTTLTIGEEAAR